MDRPRIAIIGAGNVASHLAPALSEVADLRQIMAAHFDNAAALASAMPGCAPIDSMESLDRGLDFYIIAISDSAIADVAASMPPVKGIVAHTSGSIAIDALKGPSANYGVFYPLQTFSKAASVDMPTVPFFIEGSTPEATQGLMALASEISGNVIEADSGTRSTLHLAAVFACNFSNHLWSISHDILAKKGIPFSVLEPLLRATLDKAMSMDPAKAQTGPAARNDEVTISKQQQALEGSQKEIYSLITQAIIKQNEQNRL